MLSTVVSSQDTAVNKADKISALLGSMLQREKEHNKQKSKCLLCWVVLSAIEKNKAECGGDEY